MQNKSFLYTVAAHSGGGSRGSRIVAGVSDRRAGAQLLARRREALSYAARDQYLDAQARGLGRATALRSRLGREDADRRRRASARIRRPDAKSPRGNPQRHAGAARARAGGGFARGQRKLDSV